MKWSGWLRKHQKHLDLQQHRSAQKARAWPFSVCRSVFCAGHNRGMCGMVACSKRTVGHQVS